MDALSLEQALPRLDRLVAVKVLVAVSSLMSDPLGFLRTLRVLMDYVPPGAGDDENVAALLHAIDERLDEVFSAASAAVASKAPG
jgi:hypothetical protein